MYFQIGRLGLPVLAVVLLAGCGQGDGTEADTGVPFTDVVVIGGKDNAILFDQRAPSDTVGDNFDKDQWPSDNSVEPDGILVDVSDTSPEIHPIDVVLDSLEDTAPELVDTKPPADIEEDEEEDIPPDLCNGQLCPTDRPMCNNGQCVCTGDSCTEGTYCSGGQCVPCKADAHCGLECVSCSSEGLYCAADGSHCIGCDSEHSCNPGFKCINGDCTNCEELGMCGPDCLTCTGQTPACVDGECECDATSCGVGQACEQGMCIVCSDSDPNHCGEDCLVCQGGTPHCHSGACVFCDQDILCGPNCVPCTGSAPFCAEDASGCVECLVDADCTVNEHCDGGECVSNCLAQGCASDNSMSAKKCSEPKIVGRLDATGGVLFAADTTNDGSDDDYGTFFNPGPTKCWDAADDNFYRIYLMTGDQLAVDLNPTAPLFDAMLKLYANTICDGNEDELVDCWNDGDDAEFESFVYTADHDGWFTVVVDGRRSFTEDADWGTYTVSFGLTCSTANCCCP